MPKDHNFRFVGRRSVWRPVRFNSMIFSVHEEGSALVGRHSHGPWSFLFWMRHSARSGQSVLWTVLWKWPTHLSYDITSSSTCQLISLKTVMSSMHSAVSLLHDTCNRNTHRQLIHAILNRYLRLYEMVTTAVQYYLQTYTYTYIPQDCNSTPPNITHAFVRVLASCYLQHTGNQYMQYWIAIYVYMIWLSIYTLSTHLHTYHNEVGGLA